MRGAGGTVVEHRPIVAWASARDHGSGLGRVRPNATTGWAPHEISTPANQRVGFPRSPVLATRTAALGGRPSRHPPCRGRAGLAGPPCRAGRPRGPPLRRRDLLRHLLAHRSHDAAHPSDRGPTASSRASGAAITPTSFGLASTGATCISMATRTAGCPAPPRAPTSGPLLRLPPGDPRRDPHPPRRERRPRGGSAMTASLRLPAVGLQRPASGMARERMGPATHALQGGFDAAVVARRRPHAAHPRPRLACRAHARRPGCLRQTTTIFWWDRGEERYTLADQMARGCELAARYGIHLLMNDAVMIGGPASPATRFGPTSASVRGPPAWHAVRPG